MNISDSRYQVDGSTSDNHGWLGSECLGCSSVDVLSGDSINQVSVLMESEVSKGQEVLGNFLKSILLGLEVGEDGHLQLGLGLGEFLI